MGTSNLYAYEMQDSVWGGFSQSIDHIVPYPINEVEDLYGGQSDSREKPWDGELGVARNAHNSGKYFIQRKGESGFLNLTKKKTMLDKSSWPCTPKDGFYSQCNGDTDKEVISLPSDDMMIGDQDFKGNIESVTEFCSVGGILNEDCATVGNNIYDYPPSQIPPQTNNQINIFENDNDGKEGSDLLYYGWPDIGNFEEVDQMFRSCDSTFGQGSLPNEEEMCWFPSSYDNEGSGDATKSGFHVSNYETSGQKGISEGHEASRPGNAGTPISYYKNKNSTMSHSTLCQNNEVEAITDEKSNLHKKRQRGKKMGQKDGYFENCGYLQPGYSPQNFVDERDFSGNSSSSIEQHKDDGKSLTFTCKQEDAVHQHSSFCHHPSDQVSVFSSISSGLSENNENPSSSAKDSSYSSNQVLSVDTGQGLSFSPPISENQYTEKFCCQEDMRASLSRNHEHVDFEKDTATYYKQDCYQKQLGKFDHEIEGHSGVEGISTGITRDIGSTNTLDNSFTGSAAAEISLEAKSFHELQQVMEKLDIKTKLCIRDGLYRLARSAEKRHDCEILNDNIRHSREVNGVLPAMETDKCTGFMDMETNTNPIDRSIAHLLFHGPSGASITAGGSDGYSFSFLPYSNELSTSG